MGNILGTQAVRRMCMGSEVAAGVHKKVCSQPSSSNVSAVKPPASSAKRVSRALLAGG